VRDAERGEMMPNPNNHPYELLKNELNLSHAEICSEGRIAERDEYDLRTRIMFSWPISKEHAEKIVAGLKVLTGTTYTLETLGITLLAEGQTYERFDAARHSVSRTTGRTGMTGAEREHK
jgi:hypothetical protein